MANKKSKTRTIKRVVKCVIAFGIIILIVVLAFFVKYTHTFEDSNMKKWAVLSETQRITTLHRVVSEPENQDLLIACMDKISSLPDSDDMVIRHAIALCYNGIKLSAQKDEEEQQKQ